MNDHSLLESIQLFVSLGYQKLLHSACFSPSSLPLEERLRAKTEEAVLLRIAQNLVRCTPMPQLGDTVVISLEDTVAVRISRHYSRGFPVYDDNIAPLFLLLSSSHIISLLQIMLLEGKVILYSRFPALLTNVAPTLRRLLFPWRYAGSFIPLLPSSMLLAVQVPGGYVIGIETVGSQTCYDSRSSFLSVRFHQTL